MSFQGRNTAGDVGLFPQSYTSVDPPSDSPLSSPTVFTPVDSLPITEPIAALPAAVSDLQLTLEKLQVEAQQTTNGDTSSIKSRSSQISRDGKNSDDDDIIPANSNPRAVLAAKAAANAEKDASNERAREKAERERVQSSYDLSMEDPGMVDGLQLSEESDEEDVAVQGGLLPQVTYLNGDTIHRPRVNSSTSATSVYEAEESKASIRPPTPPRAITPPPLLTALPITSTLPATSTPSTPLLPASARSFALDTYITPPVVATAAAVTAIGATSAAYLATRAPSPKPVEEPVFIPAPVAVLPPVNIPPPIILPSNINTNMRAVNTPPPTLVSHFLNSHPSQTFVSSPANSLGSMNQSRSSSRQESGNYASAGTSDTSLRDSYGNGTSVSRSTNMNTNTAALPADPTTWGVREVVEWGKMKGFDSLTLSKFEGTYFSLPPVDFKTNDVATLQRTRDLRRYFTRNGCYYAQRN